MVPSENGDAVSIACFEQYHKSNALYRIVTSIHVIPHEEVVRIRRESTDLEELHQVVKLTMNIAHDCNGTGNVGHIAFIRQYCLRGLTECKHLILCEVLALLHPRNLAVEVIGHGTTEGASKVVTLPSVRII